MNAPYPDSAFHPDYRQHSKKVAYYFSHTSVTVLHVFTSPNTPSVFSNTRVTFQDIHRPHFRTFR